MTNVILYIVNSTIFLRRDEFNEYVYIQFWSISVCFVFQMRAVKTTTDQYPPEKEEDDDDDDDDEGDTLDQVNIYNDLCKDKTFQVSIYCYSKSYATNQIRQREHSQSTWNVVAKLSKY